MIRRSSRAVEQNLEPTPHAVTSRAGSSSKRQVSALKQLNLAELALVELSISWNGTKRDGFIWRKHVGRLGVSWPSLHFPAFSFRESTMQAPLCIAESVEFSRMWLEREPLPFLIPIPHAEHALYARIDGFSFKRVYEQSFNLGLLPWSIGKSELRTGAGKI